MQIVNDFIYLTSITCTTVRSPPWSSCTEQATVCVPALGKVYSTFLSNNLCHAVGGDGDGDARLVAGDPTAVEALGNCGSRATTTEEISNDTTFI